MITYFLSIANSIHARRNPGTTAKIITTRWVFSTQLSDSTHKARTLFRSGGNDFRGASVTFATANTPCDAPNFS